MKFKIPPLNPATTPFFRRWFGDEKQRELEETAALHQEVSDWYATSKWAHENTLSEWHEIIFADIAEAWGIPEQPTLALALYRLTWLLLHDRYYHQPEPIQWELHTFSLKELAELRHDLWKRQRYIAHQDRFVSATILTVTGCAHYLIDHLPELPRDERALFNVPLHFLIKEPVAVIEFLVGLADEEGLQELDLFRDVRQAIYENACAVNGVIPYEEHKRPLKTPEDLPNPPDQLVDMFLVGTPFHEFLGTTVPLHIPREVLWQHHHICAGTGAGKTQFLSHLILHHLDDPSQPSVVVVDSQGDLIRSISRLARFKERRLIIISPTDIEHPPAINIFDFNTSRMGQYDEVTREQVIAGAIETIQYLFAGILGGAAELTPKQNIFFRFIARLLFKLPEVMGRNATLLDMLAITVDIDPYREVIEALPPLQRDFFLRDFEGRDFKATREQLRYRLNGILENPTLQRLFTAERTKLDLYGELNQGAVILIDTSYAFLKETSGQYGRIFIALIFQAIMERAAIPEAQRRPSYLIVDEAHEYFKEGKIDNLLVQARKYRLGCTFAHQFLRQCGDALAASLAANTAIKQASVAMEDARKLAPNMKATPEFLTSQPQLSLATYIRGYTPTAMAVPVKYGVLEAKEQLTDAEYEAMWELNRSLVADLPEESQTEEEASADTRDDEVIAVPPEDIEIRPPDGEGDDPTKPGRW